jgi:phosphate transport system protein
MSKVNNTEPEDGVRELQEMLVEMGNVVDSLLSDSVVALLEGDDDMARTAQTKDYRAHDCWLKVDKMCRQLLCEHELTDAQVEKVTSALKMALDMRRIADECYSAARAARHMNESRLESTALTDFIPRMAELAQDILETSLKALMTQKPSTPASQRETYRELESVNRKAFTALTEDVQADSAQASDLAELLLVARTLERIGDSALDVSNHVGHFYRPHRTESTAVAEGTE